MSRFAPYSAPARSLAAWTMVLALVLALVLAAVPTRAAETTYYSIQVGTFANPDNALRYHARLLKALPPLVADQLRLERIGSLHVLRIGQAASREDLAPLLEAVRAVVDSPRLVAVDFLPERFLIPPRRADLAGSQPKPPAVASPTPAASIPAPEGLPKPADPGAEFAVQAASYTEPEAAEKAYKALRAALPPAAAGQLRLEAVGDHFVLRLGRAAVRTDLAPLLEEVRSAGEKPEVLAVDYRPERFLIPPGGPAPRQAAPVTPEPAQAATPAPTPGPAPRKPPEVARTVATIMDQAAPAAPSPAPAERLPQVIATGHTVQLDSFASPRNALRMHAQLLKSLPPDLADQLRVERVGIYHVLRLGLAPTRAEMLPVLERVRAYTPMPVLLAVDLDPERLVVPPRGLGHDVAPAAPSPLASKPEEPSPAALTGTSFPPAEPSVSPAADLTAGAIPVPGAAVPEAPASPAVDEPLPPLLPFGSTVREQDLMQARIATRTGHFPQGKKLYEKLLAEHPGDEEILEQYVDALVDAMEYDLAQRLLADWTKRAPDNPRPRRLLGLMYVRAGEFERSYAPFEDLLARDPGDIGTMADLGFAKLGGGDWQDALELFSTVADEQPENEVAAQVVQELLIAHRPRLTGDVVMEKRSDETVLTTQANQFSSPLSDRWALDLKYGLTHVDRPSKDTQSRIGHTIQDWMLTVREQLHKDLVVFLGLGAVDGIGDRLTQQTGLEWHAHRPGRVLVLVERNRPWLDRVDATRYEGFQDHASLAYDALYDDRWGLYLAAERFRYTILDEELGNRNLGTARITRRLGWKPNLWAGYSYGFGSSEYTENGPRVYQNDALALPVTLDREEERHSWFLTSDERLCRNIRLLLSGGGGINTISGNSFFFGTGEVLVEVSNRLTVRTGTGYNSDKSNVGGETTTYTLGILWIF